MDAMDGRPTPYRDMAWKYRHAGWPGVLPLPFRRKKSPPEGWTEQDTTRLETFLFERP